MKPVKARSGDRALTSRPFVNCTRCCGTVSRPCHIGLDWNQIKSFEEAARFPCFSSKEVRMFRSSKFVAGICLAAGALLGYAAASGNINPFQKAQASPADQSRTVEKSDVA